MIDQILGKPSPTLRRSQIFLVLFFWLWRLYKGDGSAAPLPSRTSSALNAVPSGRIRARNAVVKRTWALRLWVALVGKRKLPIGWISRLNERLRNFTPYQLILGTLTFVYALRHLDDLLGLGAPEPIASLYSRSYYRATYVNTAFDAGFASAMAIRPKWVKDIASMLFTVYYLVWASEGDEVLRRYRAVCTVEMLRTTWEKTKNPYVRLITFLQRPYLPVVREVYIPRPTKSSRSHLPPVKAMLFFPGDEAALAKASELIMDFPGGGFIAMGPECHEERLRRWAKRTGKPVLAVDYGKSPEYPFPWAIEEGFDAYRTLMETKGSVIGMKSGKLGIVLTGDSAGGNICTTIVLRILEHPTKIPRPVSIILAYPCLDFNFTSWMSPGNLRVLRTEQSEAHLSSLAQQKDHMRHKSPLSVVNDVEKRRGRQKSWGEAISSKIPGLAITPTDEKSPPPPTTTTHGPVTPTSPIAWTRSLPRTMSTKLAGWLAPPSNDGENKDDGSGGSASEEPTSEGSGSDSEDDVTVTGRQTSPKRERYDNRKDAEKPLRERVKTPKDERRFELSLPKVTSPKSEGRPLTNADSEVVKKKKRKQAKIGTRLTMTSRVSYFQDRTISPTMMRAMAILYVGPKRNPDFESDYYISPILSPPHLLEHFPPVYLICGERDPFVDDTVIFSGKIREAKRFRRAEAENKSNSRSARFGEGLRMSSQKTVEIPDHILRETDDDWVQMRIIEGWGHGFMQMAALMKEVEGVLTEMADWIDESFEKASEVQRDIQDVAAAHQAARAAFQPDAEVLLSPEEHLLRPSSTHVKPVKTYQKNSSLQTLGGADLGAPILSDLGGEDGVIAFTPKTKKKTLPASRFTPVPRRASKEELHRISSAPKFDVDESTSSNEAFSTRPPANIPSSSPTDLSRGQKAFAFFNARNTTAAPAARPIPQQPTPPGGLYYGDAPKRRSSNGTHTNGSTPPIINKPTNSLVAAAVAGARAASPALAAAGLVPQNIEHVSEAELLRRRRMEAVFGMNEAADDHSDSEDEDDDDDEDA